MTDPGLSSFNALNTGAVDLNDPGPSSARSYAPGQSRTMSLLSSTDDHSNDTLGLPPDAQVIRVPEGETYRVRAVYDFAATDESALSFNAGDVIEVLTMLPSGWWDGMLGNARGWFPSNYVEDVDETELGDDKDVEDEDGYSTYSDKRYMSPDGRTVRNGSAADLMDQRGGWNDWGSGADTVPSLDDVAHEVMAGRERDASATADKTRSEATDGEDTVRPSRRRALEREDTWVPSLTPDGRLYYHNTQTGEESWSIPGADLQLDISANTSQYGDGMSEVGGSRYIPTRPSRAQSVTSSPSRPVSGTVLPEDFRPPPGRGGHPVPHPWVARLSDDGRGWYYLNQATGETRRDPPPTPNRIDAAGTPQRTGAHGPSTRSSNPASHRRTKDWEDRIRYSLAPLYAPPARPTVASLVDAIHDAISEVYSAALDGVSADEELAVARSTHTGLALAIQHDEDAIERATEAIDAVVSTVRDFVVAFGYVGPLIPTSLRDEEPTVLDDTMQRPPWAGDMSLVGNLGLIQYMTHIAITTGSRTEPSANPWGAVMRAATKLRAVIDGMPHLMFADIVPAELEGTKGRRLAAWFGADALGDFMSGRFGFGPQSEGVLRPLDAATVEEVHRVQGDLEKAIANGAMAEDGGVLDIIRATSRFREAVSHIDVAVAIDLDGDLSDMTPADSHHEDVRAYADLVSKARHALRELDETALLLDSAAADVYLRWDAARADSTRKELKELGQTVETVFRALSSLLAVAQQQATMLEQGNVRGSLGARSPAVIARRAAEAHARKQSQVSIESRASAAIGRVAGHDRQGSGTSNETQRTGADAEFLDGDDTPQSASDKRRSHRLSRQSQPQSASGSQTSLVNTNRQSSSTSSLPYHQESESGSTRASNRASILKAVPSFLRRDDTGPKAKSGKKLAKLLGDDNLPSRLGSIPSGSSAPVSPPPPVPAPMSAPPAAAIRSEPAWYLSTDYPTGEIVFDDDKGGVKAGTIRALVVRLTTHVSYDNAFFQEFLLTFRSFVGPEELIDLLIERYNITPPDNLPEEQLKEWKLRKQTPVRLRVANTLKAWLDNHYHEKDDVRALDMIEEFAKTVAANGSELISRQLQQLVDRKRRGGADALSRRVLTSGSQLPPVPLVPRPAAGRPIQLLDIQPLEMARQLTILESQYFQRIKPSELLHKAWQGENSAELSPHVGYAIFHANRVTDWIVLNILQVRDIKVRATVIRQWIRVCVELRSLNNFASMANVVAGLSASPISRLKKTWDLVSDKTISELHDLQAMMDQTKNFAKYKEMLKTTNPPCVPFLGFYLTSLVFIEDGNRDLVPAPAEGGVHSVPMTPTQSQTSMMPRRPSVATSATSVTALSRTSAWSSNGSTAVNGSSGGDTTPGAEKPPPLLINFHKRHMTADILRDIQQYQSMPYNLATSQPVMQYIEKGLEAGAEEKQKQDLYDLSLVIEPKDPSMGPPR